MPLYVLNAFAQAIHNGCIEYELSNAFNNHFSDISPRLANEINLSENSPSHVDYLCGITGGDSSNKGCFGRKTNLFWESGDFAGNRETWEIFREI